MVYSFYFPEAFPMLSRALVAFVVCAVGLSMETFSSAADRAAIRAAIDKDYDHLEALYKHLHSHPELSLEEKETAARMAAELKEAGIEVTTGIGAHGVVGVLKNGEGPKLMIRADMDGLPV